MHMLHFYSQNKLPFHLSNPCLFLQGTAGYAADTGGWWVQCGVAWFPGSPEGWFDAPKGGCFLQATGQSHYICYCELNHPAGQ